MTGYCKGCGSIRRLELRWQDSSKRRIRGECAACGKWVKWVSATAENKRIAKSPSDGDGKQQRGIRVVRLKKSASVDKAVKKKKKTPSPKPKEVKTLPTAETARQMGFSAFTTTLLISPHQKHDLLQEIGDEVAEENGIDFLYVDLRKRYSDSRRMTKPMNLHRQQYCGCVYSEWERYANITIE